MTHNIDYLSWSDAPWDRARRLFLGRTWGMNNGSVDDGALAQRQAFLLQLTVDDRKDCRSQLMLLQQVPEVHDRGVFRNRRTQRQACKLAHGGDFVARFLHGGIAQGKPVLQQMNAQHGLQCVRLSTATSLGVERFDQAEQACPGYDLIHLGQEALASGLLALSGVLEVGKAHLAHGRLGSGGQAIFAHPRLVRRIPRRLEVPSGAPTLNLLIHSSRLESRRHNQPRHLQPIILELRLRLLP